MRVLIRLFDDNADGTYSATMTNTVAEDVTVSVAIDGSTVVDTVDVTLAVHATLEGETINFNGLEYKTVLSPTTGRIWLDRNLGATQVATSRTDIASYGHYYQWGRNDDGHELGASSLTTVLASTITPATNKFITNNIGVDWVAADVDSTGTSRLTAWADGGTNDICPVGFRVPTEAEMRGEFQYYYDLVVGVTFNNFLKIPFSGYRDARINTLLNHIDRGIKANFWTSSLSNSYFGVSASVLRFEERTLSSNLTPVYHGMSIRCIED